MGFCSPVIDNMYNMYDFQSCYVSFLDFILAANSTQVLEKLTHLLEDEDVDDSGDKVVRLALITLLKDVSKLYKSEPKTSTSDDSDTTSTKKKPRVY